jgi:hypothetical protein
MTEKIIRDCAGFGWLVVLASLGLLFAFVAPTVTDAQGWSESQAASDALPAAIPDGPAVSPLVVSLTLERASALLDAALRLGRHHDYLAAHGRCI